MQQDNSKKILLVGNPNVGKSTIFNSLCNRKQKTGNYAGVTVSSHSGDYVYQGENVEVVDLPGAYSIYTSSEDEAILIRYLIEQKGKYLGVVYIVEALSIKRGLLMLRQIQDLKIPMLLVVNQIDEAKKRGVEIDFEALEQNLGMKVFQTNAKTHVGVDELREAIFQNQFKESDEVTFHIPIEHQYIIDEISKQNNEPNLYKSWVDCSLNEDLTKKYHLNPKRIQVQESIRRYQDIEQSIKGIVRRRSNLKGVLSEKVDKILVHRVFGYVVFALLLLLVFNCVFFLAEYPMGWIEDAFAWLSEITKEHLPEGPLNSLISDGIIPGIGGIVVFAPQIGILLYFLFLLEDSGYMARVVFLMDRFLRPFGLNGKSIVPLVSGAACAVPAIMSARNIENKKERLLTVLVTPFTTCSARLPIYAIIIGLIIPDKFFFGISYKALVLLGMYYLGFAMALITAFVLKKVIKTDEKSFLVMDLPTYKMPLWGHDFRLTLGKVWEFISNAGRIIFAVSIILWALSYFGPKQEAHQIVASDVEMKDSYLAILGEKIEPAVRPLGYDWKVGVGILTSFAARETFVGTIAVLYGLEDINPESEEGEMRIIDRMRADLKPDGTKVFSLATGVSLLLFYAFAMQCISTIATVYRETRSWKWTLGQLVGMSGLAYILSFIFYQILK